MQVEKMREEPDGTITYFPLDSPTSEVAVAWYLELTAPAPPGNIMAMVFRDGPDQPWKCVMRSRFYRDALTDEQSKDERRGFMATSEDRDTLIAKTDIVFAQLTSTLGGPKVVRIDQHRSLDEFMEIWSKQPWSHMRVESVH